MSDWREDLLDIEAEVALAETGIPTRFVSLRTRDARHLLERVKELESFFGRVGYPSDWEQVTNGLLWTLNQLDIYADWNDDSDAADRVRELRFLAASGNEQKEPRA